MAMQKSLAVLSVLSGVLSLGLLCRAADDAPTPAAPFNGKDLTGWKIQAEASYTVENGELVCRTVAKQKDDSWIFSDIEYTDFTLDIDFKATEKCNSGIAIRMPKDASGSPDMHGYEVQISDAPGLKPTGSILHHIESKTNNVHKANEWNHLTITCQGERIVVVLNGLPVIDSKEKGSKKGRIGMQVPKGEEFASQEVRFKNIKVTDLSGDAATAPAAATATAPAKE